MSAFAWLLTLSAGALYWQYTAPHAGHPLSRRMLILPSLRFMSMLRLMYPKYGVAASVSILTFPTLICGALRTAAVQFFPVVSRALMALHAFVALPQHCVSLASNSQWRTSSIIGSSGFALLSAFRAVAASVTLSMPSMSQYVPLSPDLRANWRSDSTTLRATSLRPLFASRIAALALPIML